MAQQVALTRAEEERAASVEEQQCLSNKAQELEAEVERLRGELVAKDEAREEDAVTHQVAQTKAEEERAAHAEIQRSLSTKAQELEEELERLREELVDKDKACEEDAMAQQVALTRAEEERAASVEEQQGLSKKAQELEAEVERLRGELVAKDKACEEDAVTQQVAQAKAEEE